ncbi:hypothetical protein CEXT_467861 [Caerostris extrusa]|uniref:Uncharacterized protein n=1 Tax=Caerostris extrusa TaxID=172846 RepID=A0AAV4VJ07_CAEEX|nr:hypothetical protein CEXT_467861 [Caerostris extrusa]
MSTSDQRLNVLEQMMYNMVNLPGMNLNPSSMTELPGTSNTRGRPSTNVRGVNGSSQTFRPSKYIILTFKQNEIECF